MENTLTKKSGIQKLPKKIVADLNKNSMFNIFGLVNIHALRARVETRIGVKTLKRLIKERFDDEMATGKVEFLDEQKKK